MANLPDPVDEGLMTLASATRRINRLFARDGVDEDERAALALLDAGIAPIRTSRALERWHDYARRGGDLESRYARSLAADAGLSIQRLEVTPKRAKVIRIRRHEGGTAA